MTDLLNQIDLIIYLTVVTTPPVKFRQSGRWHTIDEFLFFGIPCICLSFSACFAFLHCVPTHQLVRLYFLAAQCVLVFVLGNSFNGIWSLLGLISMCVWVHCLTRQPAT